MIFKSSREQDREFGEVLIQDQDFTDSIGERCLAAAIAWIGENLAPDDVFDKDDLQEWVAANAKVEDVYDEDVLSEWAECLLWRKSTRRSKNT